jgi:hypothetical protein
VRREQRRFDHGEKAEQRYQDECHAERSVR